MLRSGIVKTSATESGITRYRCQARAGPRTQSSHEIPDGRGRPRISPSSCAQALVISSARYWPYFSLLTRTRIIREWSSIAKSKGIFFTVPRVIRSNPHAVALCCASPIATTGRYPRVIRHHFRTDPEPVFLAGNVSVSGPCNCLAPAGAKSGSCSR